MQDKDHLHWIEEAVSLSIQGMDKEAGGPFGCVIVKNNRKIAEAYNQVHQNNDPTAHAEVEAIRRACKALKALDLSDCVLYASCEPCPMCLGAIYWARIPVVFYACEKQDAAKAGFDDQFIYEEIERKPEERNNISMHQMGREKGKKRKPTELLISV